MNNMKHFVHFVNKFSRKVSTLRDKRSIENTFYYLLKADAFY